MLGRRLDILLKSLDGLVRGLALEERPVQGERQSASYAQTMDHVSGPDSLRSKALPVSTSLNSSVGVHTRSERNIDCNGVHGKIISKR